MNSITQLSFAVSGFITLSKTIVCRPKFSAAVISSTTESPFDSTALITGSDPLNVEVAGFKVIFDISKHEGKLNCNASCIRYSGIRHIDGKCIG